MKKAIIKAFFINDTKNFPNQNIQFKLDVIKYPIQNVFTNIKLIFNELELEISKKICSYEIIITERKSKIIINGVIEIYQGFSNAYIFLNNQGTTCEFIFFRGLDEIKNFIEKKFEIEYNPPLNKKLPISLNQLETLDRANLILINCPTNINIKTKDKLLFNVEKI